MKKIICFFKGHKRGLTSKSRNRGWGVRNKILWTVKCQRCGYTLKYGSHCARLVGIEMRFGFDGE